MLISSENTRREISTFAVFFIQSLVTNLSFFGIFLLLGFGYLPNLQKSLHHGAAAHSRAHYGRMAEWLIVPPWKGGIRKFRIEGSNPSPSAKISCTADVSKLLCCTAIRYGHQKPKKPPDLDSSGSGFFVNSKFANGRQSLAASRCVSLAASAYSSGLRQKVLFAPRRAYFA